MNSQEHTDLAVIEDQSVESCKLDATPFNGGISGSLSRGGDACNGRRPVC